MKKLAIALSLLLASALRADVREEPKPNKEAKFDIFMVIGNQPEAKVGTAVEREVRSGDEVVSSTDSKISIKRGQLEIGQTQAVRYVEDAKGNLLRFSTRQETTGPIAQVKVVEGVVKGDDVELSIGDGKTSRKRTAKRPEGSVPPREIERKLLEGGIKVGKKFALSVFPMPEDPENAHEYKVSVEALETIEHNGVKMELFRVKTVMDLFGTEVTVNTWANAKGESFRMEMEQGVIKILFRRTN